MSEGDALRGGLARATGARWTEYLAVAVFFVGLYAVYFAIVWTRGSLLAPGDGEISYYPALMRAWSLWTDEILAGFPIGADPQALTWYPLRLIGRCYNALVVGAYVVAGFTMYGYARLVTQSRAGALVAGLIFSGSAFMTAHLGHLTIIHSAAWVPLMLWGAERLARGSLRGGVLLSAGVALSFLGGHPQPWAYGLYLVAFYALWRSPTALADGRRPALRFLALTGAFVAIGIAAAAVQLLPFGELAQQTARAQWSFADFTSIALPPSHLVLGIFPNLYGNVVGYYPYFGASGPVEIGFYAGLVPLLLALCAWARPGPRAMLAFWSLAGGIAVVFMLGAATPLSHLAFHLPVVDHFRAPGRAGFVYAIAVAVLAAHGVAALASGAVSRRRLVVSSLVFGCGFVATLVAVAVEYDVVGGVARASGVAWPGIARNAAVAVPIGLAACGIAICALVARARSCAALAVLAMLVCVDLASFGWFYEWRTRTADPLARDAGPAWAPILDEARRDFGRIVSIDGELAPTGPGLANLNLLFDLPSAGGYGPLLPSRYAEVSGATSSGRISAVSGPASPVWDVLGARWLLAANRHQELVLGNACGAGGAAPTVLRYALERPMDIASIRVESMLGCAVAVRDGTPLINVRAPAGAHATVLAGRDTAEWAWDRADLRATIRHARAPVAESFDAGGVQGHWYTATLPLDGAKTDSLTLDATIPDGSVIRIRRIVLTERNGTVAELPLQQGLYAGSPRWTTGPHLPGYAFAARFERYLGRAWLVDARLASDADALAALRSGSLGGDAFDPATTALVDAMPPLLATPPDAALDGTVSAEHLGEGRWRFRTRATRAALLFVSQSDYPGWRATVDGIAAPVVRANYAFQGVAVPGGEHVVELRFASRTFVAGALISALALFVLLGVLVRDWRTRADARPHVPSGADAP